MKTTDSALIVSALLAAQVACGTAAEAETAPAQAAPAQADASLDGEIIVTAQRREQSLQKVPISITALSSETLKGANLTDTLSFAKLAPNTQVRVFGTAPNIFIRGVGLNDFNTSTVSPVAVYRDEVALISGASQIYPLFDLERVEVLKGPQGTLFGKNATGGAVSYVSKRPGNDFEGYLTVDGGRFGERDFEGAVTIPVSDDFALRISGSSRQTDGDRINIFDHTRGHKVDMQALRAVAVAKPTDSLKITTIGYAGWNNNDFLTPKPIGTLPGGVDALGYTDPYPDDPRILNSNLNSKNHARDFGVTNIIEADLGSISVKSITGYDKSHVDLILDVDNSPNELDEGIFRNRAKEFTQEINISSKSSWLDWIVGAYYSWDRVTSSYDVNLLGSLSAIGADLPIIVRGGRRTRTYAGFGQATVSITPRFRVTGGIRYTGSRLLSNVSTSIIKGYFDPTIPDGAPITVIPERVVRQHFGRFSYRGAIEYDIAPRVLAYASVSHSFKEGGVYLTPLSSPNEADPYAPESNTSYEAGLKSTLFGNLLRFNVAGFYNDYKDIQAFAIGPTTGGVPSLTIQNAASARIYGLEAEVTLRPTRSLTFEGSLGWLHARYHRYPNGGADLATGAPLDFSGNPLPGAPDWTGHLAATYEFDFGAGWRAAVRGDYSYVGSRYFDSSKNPLVGDGSYGTVDARITITPPDAPVQFALWGRNLTDTTYLLNATDLRSIGFIPQYYGSRRSYGAEATLHF